MNKKLALGILSILAIITSGIFSHSALAQKSDAVPSALLLVEDFLYPPGTALTATGNWTAHSGAGTNPIVTSAPSLTLTGYPGSGVGNAVSLTTTGEDVNRTFTTQTSGSVYAAFLVNVQDASTDPAGGYFFHLGPDPVGTTFRGRVFAKKDASNNLAFGISKALTGAADIAFTPFSYSLNTTYLIVVKYTIVDGVSNDTVSMFVSTTVPASEPAPTATATDATQTDVNPGTVALRQGSTATSPTVRVDGIRVGTTWADVTQPGSVNTQRVVDFNGDGKTDFAVVRNVGGGPTGQVRWFINLNGTATTYASDWGLGSDFFVPEDYDGDQKTDIAVWRGGIPTVAAFYILQSNGNTVRIERFGQTGDDPTVVGDYDGDGRADPAVYRNGVAAGQQSTWFFRASSNNPNGNVTYVPWGLTGDIPAPGDYDGDNRNDFVVQRTQSGQGTFWMFQTQAGFAVVPFGTSTDDVVPGDYDGDGKTDIAVIRGVSGQLNWFFRPSSTGVVSAVPFAVFGNSGSDFATPGDYDGDGRTDAAVWRATTGVFWVRGSSSSVFGVQFGSSGDYPVANFQVK